MKKLVIILLLAFSYWHLAFSQIGTWKAYMAYHDVQQIQKAGDDLFVMASNDLYQYNLNDQTIYTYDKTNGMSDTYITHIKWCPSAKYLIVAYQNSNIDLVSIENDVINISDLYAKVITGDKKINYITIHEQYAYLACGFGIVKLDVQNHEISESYMLNQNILNISIENNMLYAKTDDGVICGSMSKNLIDPNNWQKATTSPSFDDDNKDYNTYIETVKKLNPGGPKHNFFFNMKMHLGKLYTVGGGWYQFDNFKRPGTIQVLNEDGEWTIYQDDIKPAFAPKYQDVNSIAVDPLNENHVMVASCSGVYEFLDGKFKSNYTAGNTDYFESAASNGDPNYVRTDGIIYDQEGNLYCLNSSSKTGIIKRSSDGKWSGFMNKALIDKPDHAMRVMKGSMMDSRGLMWFVNAHSDHPSFFCYDYQNNEIYKYDNFTNEDGVSLGNVWAECICEDKDGNIWVGTDKGPVYLTSAELEDPSRGVIQYKVPRNDGSDYADYLLAGIDITSMAIDGAGRKWFGTNGNGVYLISADNNTQIQHFTTTNSPLLSDVIESIAINQQTGEVFFGTNQGLCSYISDAVEPSEEMTEDNVYAYPNPVDLNNYTGLITITGLTFNADVKITNAAGFLINEGRSNGGLFTWDGKDKSGHRVASGVYNVITATNDGNKGVVCKIAIIK
ncbi:MAG: Por secretion system protein [Prevotella sp.]|nr:Por secretion system protein [Prevotella sp.]